LLRRGGFFGFLVKRTSLYPPSPDHGIELINVEVQARIHTVCAKLLPSSALSYSRRCNAKQSSGLFSRTPAPLQVGAVHLLPDDTSY
jgi:hypothetical protein